MSRVASGEITSEIVQKLTVLEVRNGGWNLELNIVSWNGAAGVYDIRPWNQDHSKCGKGITLNLDALKALVEFCEEAQIKEV